MRNPEAPWSCADCNLPLDMCGCVAQLPLTSLDSFLAEEGILAECTAVAESRVIAFTNRSLARLEEFDAKQITPAMLQAARDVVWGRWGVESDQLHAEIYAAMRLARPLADGPGV